MLLLSLIYWSHTHTWTCAIYMYMSVFISPSLESNSVSVVGAEALVKAFQSCPAFQFIR